MKLAQWPGLISYFASTQPQEQSSAFHIQTKRMENKLEWNKTFPIKNEKACFAYFVCWDRMGDNTALHYLCLKSA